MTPAALLGVSWLSGHRPNPYPGEPSRALTFTTREAARKVCADMLARWADCDEPLRSWRVRPVRVMETVQRVKR